MDSPGCGVVPEGQAKPGITQDEQYRPEGPIRDIIKNDSRIMYRPSGTVLFNLLYPGFACPFGTVLQPGLSM